MPVFTGFKVSQTKFIKVNLIYTQIYLTIEYAHKHIKFNEYKYKILKKLKKNQKMS